MGPYQTDQEWSASLDAALMATRREDLKHVAAATNGEKLTPSSVEQAAFTAGGIESALGHPDSALQHLSLMRELADRYDDAWLTASSRLQLGTLAVMQGRLEEAREQLDQALALSLAIRIIRNVTLCLAAFAQLAFAESDPERAALLAGAAEGLQRRAGFTTWPAMRRGEAQLTAQIRQALGTTGSVRCSLPGPDSASRRRWPRSGAGPVTTPSRPDAWPQRLAAPGWHVLGLRSQLALARRRPFWL